MACYGKITKYFHKIDEKTENHVDMIFRLISIFVQSKGVSIQPPF
jgi:hypothetical protein